MTKVVFCLPGKSFSNYFLESWTNLLYNCPNFNVEPVMRWAVSSNVYKVRDLCLMGNPEAGPDQKPFQGKIKYDYIMWIDSDSVFTPGQFESLLKDIQMNPKIHILSGLCPREGGKEYTTVVKSQPLTPANIKGEKELIKADSTGMFFTLVRAGIFEKLSYPWFQPVGIEKDGKNIGYTSEDIAFCLRAKDAGFNTFIDPKIIIGHEKTVVLR